MRLVPALTLSSTSYTRSPATQLCSRMVIYYASLPRAGSGFAPTWGRA
jgi:hypothetical protein